MTVNKNRICSVVLNTLNNDARVLRTGKVLFNCSQSFSFIAVTNKKIKGLYCRSALDKFKVYRIYSRDLSKIKNGFRRYFEWQFIVRFRLYRALKSIIKKEKYNIVYCNDFDTFIVVYLLKRKYDFKIIYDSHELWTERKGAKKTIVHRFINRIEYYLEKNIIRKCDAVITVSDGIAEELAKRYNIKKPYVIRNLDIVKKIPTKKERVLLRDKLSIPRDALLIVYQGVLADERGIPELLSAMSELPQNIHLLLMGDFLSDKSRKLMMKNNRVHYVGMIPSENLFGYTAIGEIGIVPIRTKEFYSYSLAFPNKFSQYMNASLALALYKTRESERLIKKCKCGVLFEPESSNNIVRAIEELISSGNIEKYKERARETFLKYYNWECDKHKLEKIIYKV